jgi:hypothetical protein
MLSRGFGQRPGVRDPTQLTPQIYAYAIPYAWVFTPSEQIHGISAVVARETKRAPVNGFGIYLDCGALAGARHSLPACAGVFRRGMRRMRLQ